MTQNAALGRANLLGSLWMIAAMAGFAVEDAFLKSAARQLPVGELMMIFGGGGAALFALQALARSERILTADALSRPMLVRVFFEISGRLFYTLSLALTSLSSTTAILQAAPIVVVAGAALFFGEKVGWRRWLAIFVGLCGVLVILRPSGADFSVLSLLAVLGMLGFAGRDLASRAAPVSLSTAVLGFYGFLAILVAGAGLAIWEARPMVVPEPAVAGAMAGGIAAGVFGYGSLMKAMRTGEIATVAPFRYVRLPFGVALGIVVFGETLDWPTVIGCLIVVGSGLFILARGRRAG